MGGVLLNQPGHRLCWIMVKPLYKPRWSLSLHELYQASAIISQTNLPEVLQQNSFTFGIKQDLRLSKVAEFAGRLSSADAPLAVA